MRAAHQTADVLDGEIGVLQGQAGEARRPGKQRNVLRGEPAADLEAVQGRRPGGGVVGGEDGGLWEAEGDELCEFMEGPFETGEGDGVAD